MGALARSAIALRAVATALCGSAAFALQEPAPGPTRIEQCRDALEQLVDAPTRAARRARLAQTLRVEPRDIAAWEQAIADFGRFETPVAGLRTLQVPLMVGDEREETELCVYVPPRYDPRNAAALMLSFHGTGGSGQGMHLMWQKLADELGMLVLSPSESGANDGYRFSERERLAALAALRWMRRHYNVDENRIFASGISRGGHLTWDLALRHPDLFAGVAPMIGSPRLTLTGGQNNLRLMENAAELSIRDLQGSKDDPALVYSVRLGFDLLGAFAPRDAKLLEFPDRGHDFDFLAVDWRAWLTETRREPWPDRVVRCTATRREGRNAWLEILGVDKDVQEVFTPKIPQQEWIRLDEDGQRRRMVAEAVARNARAVARRAAPGAFTLELDGVTQTRLWLRAEDLVERGNVVVTLAGKRIERRVRADIGVMLEDFAERFDRTRVVQAKLDLP